MTRLTSQATAFVLAAATTVVMLSSLDQLAGQAHAPTLAAWEAPAQTQVVVVTGKRDVRS